MQKKFKRGRIAFSTNVTEVIRQPEAKQNKNPELKFLTL